ncbi:hypothetical protein [Actinoplanes sp. NPDC049599]|uniref:hypothetical protein n=1 Tax=Actinoplanes sp. NPDC049599 TaxID=3363903 RepID=UPI0037B9E40E
MLLLLTTAGCTGIGIAVLYLLQRYGVTRTVVTQNGTETSTVTESNALALAVVTGLIALASAALTAALGHWYTISAERDRRSAELWAGRNARIREQIAAVASEIAGMLEGVRPMDEASAGAASHQRATLWNQATLAVRKAANAAVPHIGVLEDPALRDAAHAVFATYEDWYTRAEETLRGGGTEPNRAAKQAALDAFFNRARVVIADAETRDRP